jgi:hypothetical protein
MRYVGVLGLGCVLAGGAAAQPAETLSPGSNHPSGTVNVSGTGFGDYEAVDIFFDTTEQQVGVTNGSGSFSAVPITVPASALPGTHYITAIGQRSGDAAQKAFTVRTNWPQLGEGTHMQSTNLYENVLSAGTVSGLDVLWLGATGNAIFSSPAVSNGVVYVGSDDDKLYAFNATTGAKLWSATTGNSIDGSPAVAGNTVFVGCNDDYVYAFNGSTGALVWKYQTGNAISGSVTVASGVVYVGSSDGNLYALNATTGAKIWSYNTGNSIYGGAAFANGMVYFGVYDGMFYALNATNGTLLWSSNLTHSVLGAPAVADGSVYIGDNIGILHALNAVTGATRWTYMTGGTAWYMLPPTTAIFTQSARKMAHSCGSLPRAVTYIVVRRWLTAWFMLDLPTTASMRSMPLTVRCSGTRRPEPPFMVRPRWRAPCFTSGRTTTIFTPTPSAPAAPRG